ncbi:MFS transporter [Brevibacillus laterosporus]|uniref:MFS transporter n=1 Tax=Brevibacillus laterosporus TaxID=1465 RepID=UPI000CE4689C|nr:MFS transporter [Brevibacillus laterosporus]MBG9773795.1 major facilitator transporter [Brevibacillus laterosporus]MBG9800220.1 major facilitator transporter [Brevibacillus laterosporus]MCR8937890.1 MFS transporter [Brevibacillus laterosporus]MCZ0840529.1 MFS transporter [Brevibacillus laterosporus]MCZ0847417.1 MFS transporter [Brevibacillus laterosporus]
MNKRVYLLTIVSFVVGMVELIIGGILDLVATDLGVSLGKAGFLITMFSLVFAISAPILLTLTSGVERKRLTMISLLVFLIGNVIAVISPTYSMLLLARIISAVSGSLLVVLCVTIASSIVTIPYRARAIGVVFMGISASLVLGVPIGLMIGNAFGWRAPFILISILTILSLTGVHFFMDRIEPKPSIPIWKQLGTLKNRKVLFTQLTSFLFLAGHLTLYAYLTPFLKMKLGLDGDWVSIVYVIFGIAAVFGGGFGGFLADRFGTKRTILSVISIFALTIFMIPYTTFALPLFLVVMIIWSMLSWAITPALQSYLIEAAPESSDIQQSLNNSALHFGIAFGSFIGGVVIERASIDWNATVGGLIILLALGTAVFSMAKASRVTVSLSRQ